MHMTKTPGATTQPGAPRKVLLPRGELTPGHERMPTKLLHVLSFLGKAAGLALTIAGPLSGTPIGLTVFAAASRLKDAVNHLGDLADDGKPNDSFKT